MAFDFENLPEKEEQRYFGAKETKDEYYLLGENDLAGQFSSYRYVITGGIAPVLTLP